MTIMVASKAPMRRARPGDPAGDGAVADVDAAAVLFTAR
jgi:hypothetical protein